MTPSEWATITGLIGTAAGMLIGYGIKWGKISTVQADQGRSLAQVVDAFARCQQRGTECTASTRVLLETNVRLLHDLQADFAVHKTSVHQHHESQTIHTTDEWRRSVMDRLDRIEEGVRINLDAQTKTLLQRIEAVERLVRNGNGK